jgi:hypothetical protein
MMTPYNQFIDMLNKAGYILVKGTTYINIKDKEYVIDRGMPGIIFVSLGKGLMGTENAYTNLDFDANTGEFLDHSSRFDEGIVSNEL